MKQSIRCIHIAIPYRWNGIALNEICQLLEIIVQDVWRMQAVIMGSFFLLPVANVMILL